MATERGVAIIGDIVGSRRIVDRPTTQLRLLGALERVSGAVPSIDRPLPTVGDEFQALYSSINDALTATLLIRLELTDVVDTRIGIGYGEYERIPSGDTALQNGSAWWNARDAIEAGKKRETGRTPTLRTWYVGEGAGTVNAYLLARDHVVSSMDSRSHRLTLGIMQGRTQVELAKSEGITQSAVSRNLQRNGAFAIIDGAALLAKGANGQ